MLAAPMLGLLRGTSRADTGKTARRLVVFFSPNGTIHKHWRPSGGEEWNRRVADPNDPGWVLALPH